MKSEKEIISRVRKLKYMAQRYGSGFHPEHPNPDAIGSPLDMMSYRHAARQLEWVIGKEVTVKKINWYQAARKAQRRRNGKH